MLLLLFDSVDDGAEFGRDGAKGGFVEGVVDGNNRLANGSCEVDSGLVSECRISPGRRHRAILAELVLPFARSPKSGGVSLALLAMKDGFMSSSSSSSSSCRTATMSSDESPILLFLYGLAPPGESEAEPA